MRLHEFAQPSDSTQFFAESVLIGNCTQDDVIYDLFGDATNFAQLVDKYGDSFTLGNLTVEYDDEKDVHFFYLNNQVNEHEMVWTRRKVSSRHGKPVLKWRCTSGLRKGRVVPTVQDCNTPIDVAKREKMKVTRARTKPTQSRRAKRSKEINTGSRLVKQLNKALKRSKKR